MFLVTSLRKPYIGGPAKTIEARSAGVEQAAAKISGHRIT
jgi:hypothetical protein